MFPITHAYAAEEILGKDYLEKNPLAVVGSGIPDIGIFSSTLNKDDLHYNGVKFKQYLDKEKPSCSPLAIGMILHGRTKSGLDFYTHGKNDDGYAFKKGRVLIDKIKKLYGIELIRYDVISHFFIELAFEFITAHNYPETVNLIENTVYKFTPKQFEEIADCFNESDCFGGKVDRGDIVNFYEILRPKNFTDINKYYEQLPKMFTRLAMNIPDRLLLGIIPDKVIIDISSKTDGLVSKIINKEILGSLIVDAINQIKPDYKNFLKESINSMKYEIKKSGISLL